MNQSTSTPSLLTLILSFQDMYAGNATKKARGALSIAVPGELAGLHRAWRKYGRLPWKRLVRPAEQLACKGFKISPYLHMQMVKTESGILADKGLRDLLTSNGKLLQPGNICHNKKLAHTLRKISKHGIEAFYNGSIGSKLVKDIQKAGGILTREDLRRYQVKMRDPIVADILGFKILGMPPPSSGGASMMLVSVYLCPYFLHASQKKRLRLIVFTATDFEHSFPVRSPFWHFGPSWDPSRN